MPQTSQLADQRQNMTTQLAHVCLGSRDLAGSYRFYHEVLNFQVIHRFINDAGELYGFFAHAGGRTFIEIFNEQGDPSGPGLFRHLCFEVDDLQALADTLRGHGFAPEITRGRTDRTLQFWISDPDGNKIEFHQYDAESIQFRFLSGTAGA